MIQICGFFFNILSHTVYYKVCHFDGGEITFRERRTV